MTLKEFVNLINFFRKIIRLIVYSHLVCQSKRNTDKKMSTASNYFSYFDLEKWKKKLNSMNSTEI